MDRYVAFLRGMNLGGRRIKNDELRRHSEEMGFEEVAATAARRPFDEDAVASSKGKLQVSLLSKAPSAAARGTVLDLATEEDLLTVEGREVYWLPSGGLLESELDLKAIEALVGPDTRRTMGTIEQIAAKHC